MLLSTESNLSTPAQEAHGQVAPLGEFTPSETQYEPVLSNNACVKLLKGHSNLFVLPICIYNCCCFLHIFLCIFMNTNMTICSLLVNSPIGFLSVCDVNQGIYVYLAQLLDFF